VAGEIACGSIRNRGEVLRLLGQLPQAPRATDGEVLELLERRKLMGQGLGIVDVRLLASAMLGGDVVLWTADRRLAEVGRALGIAV
jgi:predicted nucleic acid-binding protein